MIRFEQVGGDGVAPKDIRVTTDDANAELAEWTKTFDGAGWTDAVTFDNLAEARKGDDGLATWIIPGDEAGEVGDLFNDLAEFLEDCNRAAVAAFEEGGS